MTTIEVLNETHLSPFLFLCHMTPVSIFKHEHAWAQWETRRSGFWKGSGPCSDPNPSTRTTHSRVLPKAWLCLVRCLNHDLYTSLQPAASVPPALCHQLPQCLPKLCDCCFFSSLKHKKRKISLKWKVGLLYTIHVGVYSTVYEMDSATVQMLNA